MSEHKFQLGERLLASIGMMSETGTVESICLHRNCPPTYRFVEKSQWISERNLEVAPDFVTIEILRSTAESYAALVGLNIYSCATINVADACKRALGQ